MHCTTYIINQLDDKVIIIVIMGRVFGYSKIKMEDRTYIMKVLSNSRLSEGEDSVTIMELRKQLRDKDMKLTDIRLEALSSAHQLEQLREAMNKMKVSVAGH